MSPLELEKYERLCRVLRKSLERNKHNLSLRRSDLALLEKYEQLLTNNTTEDESNEDGAEPNTVLDKILHG